MYTNMDKSNVIESHTYYNLSIGTEGTEISYCIAILPGINRLLQIMLFSDSHSSPYYSFNLYPLFPKILLCIAMATGLDLDY